LVQILPLLSAGKELARTVNQRTAAGVRIGIAKYDLFRHVTKCGKKSVGFKKRIAHHRHRMVSDDCIRGLKVNIQACTQAVLRLSKRLRRRWSSEERLSGAPATPLAHGEKQAGQV